jgi:preprotein translocase subunit SecG
MEIIKLLCWIIQFISAVSIIILVLLQQGKGADVGATFGSSGGASGSLFGAKGSASFLSRLTAIFATIFFITTMSLVIFSAKSGNNVADIMKGYASPSSTLNAVTSKAIPIEVKTESKTTKNQIPD